MRKSNRSVGKEKWRKRKQRGMKKQSKIKKHKKVYHSVWAMMDKMMEKFGAKLRKIEQKLDKGEKY